MSFKFQEVIMKKERWIIAVILIYVLAISGCGTPTPHYDVETYDELKDALNENVDILYPDISRYEQEEIEYVINHAPGDKYGKHGYSIIWEPFAISEDPTSETVLREFRVYCVTLEYLTDIADKSNGLWTDLEDFKPNMEVDGIAVEHKCYEKFENQEETEIAEIPESAKYPDGTYYNWNKYIFQYLGYQYEISGAVRLLPEEQFEKNIDQEVEKGRAELLDAIRTIIGQRSKKG